MSTVLATVYIIIPCCSVIPTVSVASDTETYLVKEEMNASICHVARGVHILTESVTNTQCGNHGHGQQ